MNSRLGDPIRWCATNLPFSHKPSPLDGCPMFAFLRTWVEKDGRSPSFFLPVSRCRPAVKALEKVVFNPCTRKPANMGHPSQGARLGGKPGKRWTKGQPIAEKGPTVSSALIRGR